MRDAGSQTRDVFALEQIEVIKGPGSTFTGRGSTGGSVNLVTKKPREEEFVNATVGAGTDNYGRAAFDANYRFGDRVGFRLNLLSQDHDIPGRNGVSNSHWGIAPSLAFGIGEDTRFNLDFYRYETDDIPDYSIPYTRNAANTAAAGEPVDVNSENFYGLLNRDFQQSGADVRTFQFSHDFGDKLTLTNVTRYGRTTNDYIVTNPDDGRGNIVTASCCEQQEPQFPHDHGSESHEPERRGGHGQPRAQLSVRLRSEPRSDAEPAVRRLGDVRGQCRNGVRHVVQRPRRGRRAFAYNCTTLDNPDPNDPWTGTITQSTTPTTVDTDTRSVYAFDTLGFNESGR